MGKRSQGSSRTGCCRLRDEAEQRELKRLGVQPLEISQKCLSGIILNEGWRLATAAVVLLREKARSQS